MTNPSTSTVSASGFDYIDGVLMGAKWSSTTVTFAFPSTTSELSYGFGSFSFQALNSTQRAFARDCFESYESVCGLNFVEVTNSYPSRGTIQLYESDYAGGSARVIDFPDGSLRAFGGDRNSDWNGDIAFNHSSYNGPQNGDYAGMTFFHEIGHAVGLSHGHYNQNGFGTLNYYKDSHEYSVMTYKSYIGSDAAYAYNSEGSYSTTLMQSDMAALQYLYGANYSYNSDNTTYTWNTLTGQLSINGIADVKAYSANKIFMTIWDGGGTDTYDLSNYSTDLTLDLRPGEANIFSSTQLANLGNGHYASGNVYNSLLYNDNTASLIENAIGGSGNDTITGNSAANTLSGGAGNDTLSGGAGNDTLDGGSGNDSLSGGAGDDTYYVDSTSDTVTESSDEGTDTVHSSVTWSLGSNVENLTLTGSSAIDGTGNDAANTLTGNSAANTLSGGSGNDSLYMDAGDDSLQGGTGTDWLLIDSSTAATIKLSTSNQQNTGFGTDVIENIENASGGSGDDTIKGTGGHNTLKGNDGNDLLYGRNGDDVLYGDAGNDTLYGDRGADTLYGGTGADTLAGGFGLDTLEGGAGADSFVFNLIGDSGATAATADVISDFVSGTDKINLSAIDASVLLEGNNSFTFDGTSAFSSSTEGEIYYEQFDVAGSAGDYTMIYVDNDADAGIEMAIKLVGLHTLTADDFLL